VRGFKRWLIGAGLIAVTLVVFSRLAKHDFVNYDDPGYVTENRNVRSGLTRDGLAWAFRTTAEANWHPLTWLSHMLDCQLYGLNAGAHHLTSLLFHAANTLLLFVVLSRMTGTVWRSALVAALFALHPLHVESVAWVAERKDVLSAFFWMMTLGAYARYVERPRLASYVPVLVFLALGLMAKPMLVTLPFVLLLLDFWPLRRLPMQGREGMADLNRRDGFGVWDRGVLLEKIPLVLLAAASSLVTFSVQKSGGTVVSAEALPLTLRVSNAIISYGSYILKMFWPSGLAVFYPSRAAIGWELPVSVMLIAGVSILVIRALRRRPYLAVGWFWYLGTLVPVIGLVQVGEQAMADRYTYIPLIGLFIMIAWGVPELLHGTRYAKTALGFSGAIVLAALAVCTWFQLGYWKNSVTLFKHAIEVTDGNRLAELNLGAALVSQGRLQEAVAHYRDVLRRSPDLAEAHVNLGATMAAMGNLEQAIDHYQQALEIMPDAAEAHNNLGAALMTKGELDRAATHLAEALRIKPGYAEAQLNLGKVLARQGRVDDAVAHYFEALRIRSDYPEAQAHLGVALVAQGKFEEAKRHFSLALQMNPADAFALYQLGLVCYREGLDQEAVAHLREVLRLKPEWPDALNTLAWILATQEDPQDRDIEESVRLAQRARELAGQPAMLDTLAAAYAAGGRFEEAIETAEQALAMASSSGETELAAEIKSRLQLYQSRRPFRQARAGAGLSR
jgi:protein O-mannosyl-transferase